MVVMGVWVWPHDDGEKSNLHINAFPTIPQESDLYKIRYPRALRMTMLCGLMISLVILVEVAAGMSGKFEKFISEEAADVIANEPGCVQFVVSRSMDDPNLFTLAEFYVDEAALDAHRQTPHFLLFQERAKEFGLIAKKTPVLGEVIFP